jgi:hypothetical protein
MLKLRFYGIFSQKNDECDRDTLFINIIGKNPMRQVRWEDNDFACPRTDPDFGLECLGR